MALTAAQIADMQGDLGITDDEAVFTDAELNRLFTRAGEVYEQAVYLGWRQLMADASKFFNYTAGNTRVERKALFDHVKEMVKHWQAEADQASNAQGVRMVGLTEVPPRVKDAPGMVTSRNTLPWKWPR